ncbi:hypothetical protein HaLaN_21198 [Haematococcus lacustris]|uniref:Uncharacterized protein n=1 Tax=Haematococcus lacustris TaxID=44745 RepID=A0A699ZVB5_HAELA|nr:hypothetical protein HaLaN_21198 [Haematococcus lacustris]
MLSCASPGMNYVHSVALRLRILPGPLQCCEIAVVKATDSVPNAHFSSAFCHNSLPTPPTP